MNQAQRIIKYLALAFAVALVIGIFGTIFGLLAAIGLIEDIHDGTDEHIYTETVIESNISKLDIDTSSAGITITVGNEFKISADSDHITVRENGECLAIEEKDRFFWSSGSAGNVTITLPEDAVFKTVELDAGAGEISIDRLAADKLDFELGAGNVKISGISVSGSANIDGGAGKILITESEINGLQIEMGVGDLELFAKLTGNNSIDFGVGKSLISLTGSEDDYRLSLDNGIGKATIDGKEIDDGSYYGNGGTTVQMDGGIGEIVVSFSE